MPQKEGERHHSYGRHICLLFASWAFEGARELRTLSARAIKTISSHQVNYLELKDIVSATRGYYPP